VLPPPPLSCSLGLASPSLIVYLTNPLSYREWESVPRLFFFFFPVGLGLNSGLLQLQSICSQSRCFTTWAMPPVHYTLVILEMESPKLFA
jgi:hypothetical protein